MCEGESGAEVPARPRLPLLLFAEVVRQQKVYIVAAVKYGEVLLAAIVAIHVRERVGGPEVEPLGFVAQGEVNAVGAAGFGFEIGVGGGQFVAVDADELGEALVVWLDVELRLFGEVNFESGYAVEGALDAVFGGFAGARLEEAALGAGEEAHKEVHDVEFVDGADQVLRVEAAGELEAEVVVEVHLDAEARFDLHIGLGGEVLEAQSGFEDDVAELLLEFEIAGNFGVEIFLFEIDVEGVLEAEVGIETGKFKAVVDLTSGVEGGKVHDGGEGIDGAGARASVGLFEGDEVVAAGGDTFDEDIGVLRDEGEVGAATGIGPAEVGDIDEVEAVGEIEPEQVELAAVFADEGHFGVQVGKAEGKADIAEVGEAGIAGGEGVEGGVGSVAIEHLGGLVEVGVFAGDEEGGAAAAAFLQFLDGPFEEHFRLEGACRDEAAEFLAVAFAGFDIYNGGNAAAVFGVEAAGEHIHAADGLGFEYGEEANGVERVVDGHAIEEDAVLHGRAAADVELAALVAGRDDAR